MIKSLRASVQSLIEKVIEHNGGAGIQIRVTVQGWRNYFDFMRFSDKWAAADNFFDLFKKYFGAVIYRTMNNDCVQIKKVYGIDNSGRKVIRLVFQNI